MSGCTYAKAAVLGPKWPPSTGQARYTLSLLFILQSQVACSKLGAFGDVGIVSGFMPEATWPSKAHKSPEPSYLCPPTLGSLPYTTLLPGSFLSSLRNQNPKPANDNRSPKPCNPYDQTPHPTCFFSEGPRKGGTIGNTLSKREILIEKGTQHIAMLRTGRYFEHVLL